MTGTTWLVLGSASCVWQDLKKLSGDAFTYVLAVNDMIKSFPGTLQYGATVHYEKAEQFKRPGVTLFSTRDFPGVDTVHVDHDFQHGSSGLYGVGVALHLGARHVVVAGCPMDRSPRYNRLGEPGLDDSLDAYRDFWVRALPLMQGRVSSASGWTRDLLNGRGHR